MARSTRSKPEADDTSKTSANVKGRSASSARRTSQRHPTFVDNSSELDPDLATDSATPPKQTSKATRSSGRRVLDAVVIPTMEKQTTKDEPRVTESASSLSSANSSTRDNSVAYDSPNTTAVNTPAEGVASTRNTGPKFSLGGMSMGISNKRKQATKTFIIPGRPAAHTGNDEEIARQMQEEEYGGTAVASGSGTGKNKSTRGFIDDSDSEELSSVLSSEDSGSDDEPLAKRPRPSKAVPKGRPARFGDPPQTASVRKAARTASSQISKKLQAEDEDEEMDVPNALSSDDDFDGFSDEDEPLMNRRGSTVSTLSSAPSGASTPSNMVPLRNTIANRRAERRAEARRLRLENMRGRGKGPYDRKAARRNKLEKAHPEINTMWDDLAKIPIITPDPAEQPESINRTLKSFQLEGLDWMIRQEQSTYKGGLLGDEMGMGKTIQAVSLIMSDFPAKEPTLVLVPPVALMQWANEISEYTNGKLKVLIVHNTNAKSKNLGIKTIRAHNVVIMSYNSLESMFRKQEKGWTRGDNIVKEDSPIHSVKFHRLILDEAHSIKQRTTGVAKACFALKGKYKWCLSGTPVQNRIGEFFSLLRFLEVRPFADYFCERCPCAQLHWSVGDDYMCTHCKHSAAEHRSVFNEELLNPITGDSMQLRSEALDKLHMITKRVMLRRLKKDHTASMELPPKEVVIHNEFFGEIERDFSSSIMSNSARKFDTYVAQGVMLNNYANIFGLIMQMRQVANHPDLITRKHVEGGQNILICCLCDEPAEEPVKSRCQGKKCSFCRSCVKNFIQGCEGSGSEADCPRCHVPLSIDWDQPEIVQDEDAVKKSSIINRIKMEDWTSSTKIEMLVYDLYKLRSKKQTLKSIVFSQFTSMLQLIEWRLRRAGFNTVMLDGSMTPVQRQRSIDYFMNNTDVEVFLVSLKAGGVALNLTEASRVFIVDPWWNPAAEWQSADRCHRIGQTRPCVITRLVIEDSVESRMVMLQEKKASMISGTINNDKVAMDKLSPEDLQFLFRGT